MTLCLCTWMIYLCSVPLNMSMKIICRLVFQQLREHKLQAKLKKCEFGKPLVKYLGIRIVGSGEVHVDKDKVAAVTNWEPPRDIKGI